ncbi:M14 family zinc carboxypeptidase [Nanoarchaeota archaeon]
MTERELVALDDLFMYPRKPRLRELGTVQRYAELEQEMLDTWGTSKEDIDNHQVYVKKHNDISTYFAVIGQSSAGRNMYCLRTAPEKSKGKVMIVSGHHGEEKAGPLAAMKLIEEILNPEMPALETLLSNFDVMIIPCIDPDGFDAGIKLFYSDGEGRYWPRNDDTKYGDINSTWGRKYEKGIPKEVRTVRELMQTFFESLEDRTNGAVFDLHETVMAQAGSNIPGWVAGYSMTEGLGPLLIESTEDRELGADMVANLKHTKRKGLPYNRRTRAFFNKLPLLSQVKIIGEGRSTEGELFTETTLTVCTRYANQTHGVHGVTTETFLNPLDERVVQQMLLVEGGLKYMLKKIMP